MNPTFDPILKKMVAHNHIPDDITGLADVLKGFVGSLDVSSGTEETPFSPPQIETSGFWMISDAGFIDIDSSSVEFEPGDLLVYDLSENSYSRVPSIKELPVGENPGSVLFWDGTKWDSYTKFILQEDTLVITNNDTFRFIISGDNCGDFIEFNDDIGGVWMKTDLYLTNGGIWISGVPDDPEGYFKIIEPIVSNDRPAVQLFGIQSLQFRSSLEEDAQFVFELIGDNKLTFSAASNGIQYFIFEDGPDESGWMALGNDLMCIDASDPEIKFPFIQRVLDGGDTTRIDLHNIYKLHFWDEVNQAEGYLKLADGDYYLYRNSNDFGNFYCEYLMAYSSVSSLGISSTKDLFFKFHSQASAPTNEQLSPNAVCLWEQTSTGKTYLCLNTGGGIRKVELI